MLPVGNLLSNCLDIEEIGGITKGWHPHPDYTIRLSDGPLGQRPAQDTGHNENFEESDQFPLRGMLRYRTTNYAHQGRDLRSTSWLLYTSPTTLRLIRD